jgi:PTS system nitrogen regulatory IIA component
MLNPFYGATYVADRPRTGATRSAPRNAIAAILTPHDILLDLEAPTKERALEEIARFVGARNGLLYEDVQASLVEREKIGSTGVGCGVAIPHARVKYLLYPVAAFVRMKIPIPFDAPDGKPVSDLFVLLVPHLATETHLSLLAEAAEMFCDVSFREELRTCAQVDGIHAAFAKWRKP